MEHRKIKLFAEERIIAAATKIFVTKGFAGARIRHIATEANVNPAMIYYYCHSKHNLFCLVFDNALEKFLPSLAYFERSDLDIFYKMETFCDELIERQISNPFLSAFILNEIERNPESLNEEIWYYQKDKIKLFTHEVMRNINIGVIRNVDPLQLFTNIVSLCVFPFIATHFFTRITNFQDGDITDFIQQRKVEVKDVIILSIRKDPNTN